MSAILKEEIAPYRMEFLRALKPCKVHKQKPVREAALGTIMQLKEMDPPLEDHELAELEDGPIQPKKLGPERGSLRKLITEASTRSPRNQQDLKSEGKLGARRHTEKPQPARGNLQSSRSTVVLHEREESKDKSATRETKVSGATLKRRAALEKQASGLKEPSDRMNTQTVIEKRIPLLHSQSVFERHKSHEKGRSKERIPLN